MNCSRQSMIPAVRRLPSAVRRPLLLLAMFLAIVSAANAQQPPASHIGYVCPAGGRQGASLVVLIGGQLLDGTAKAFVSGGGVQAKVIDYFKPIRQGQSNSFQDKLKKLLDKKAAAADSATPAAAGKPKRSAKAKWTPEDDMLLAATRKKLAISLRGLPAPATGETVVVQLTIAADAEPGHREVRLATSKGLTNPLVFCVGQLPEVCKEISNPSEAVASAKKPKYREEPAPSKPEPPQNITLPAVVNGQIMPGGVDRYRFSARKGQRLVIAAAAQELIPYISDAVPGWFQAALALYDAKGRELAYADHYLFHPDPLLYYEVAEDGEYVVEIHDSIYRGREDFVYRITLGEVPLLTGVFPLGGPAGAETAVALQGWNLPATRLVQDCKDKRPGIYPLSLRMQGMISNAVPFAVDTLPECLEKEPNNQPENAQRVTLPVIVNGRVDRPDDWDVFRFEGRAGQEVVAEVFARRLNSPLDSLLKLTDANGRLLASNDDHEDKGSGLTTHHADSYLRAPLPADGPYYLYLGDAQHKGGPDYAYRLRIGPPRPDFDLRVVPSSINVRNGVSVPLTVYALRKDGFSGEIALQLKDAPEGFALSGETVPAGQEQVNLTLKVYTVAQQEPIRVNIVGRATIAGREVAHPAVPADNMTQAFEYRHLVPAQELEVAVSAGAPSRATVKLLGNMPIKIPAGGTARVRISVLPRTLFARSPLELRKPPLGIALAGVSPSRDGLEIVLQSDAAKVKVGLRGNLVLAPSVTKSAEPAKRRTPADRQRKLPATLPPIPFEVVAR